jgi:peptidoglycan/xylan/chitin deacetylase (PgdA/CDA1 family)
MAVATLDWGVFRSLYDTVAPHTTWHSGQRISSPLPALSPAGALIQRVQLTYDDGPDSAGNTRVVLTALNAAGARATFYLVGKRVVQGDNWRIVFDIAAAGHWLGNHAYDWNDATDNHIFLSGTSEERAEKILQTEWAIRDALIQGRDDAKKSKSWDTIPTSSRDYIEDVIAHGTGRFRTPGFKSKPWRKDEITTLGAIGSVNSVLAATGLRPLAVTELSKWGPDYEGVTVDPEDWKSGRTQIDVESAVRGGLSSNADAILLHSRVKATAEATPAILSDIKSKKWTFDPTVQGALGSKVPKPPFADLSTISNPPTSSEIAKARAWLQKHMLSFGPFISGAVAIGIFQMAQQAGSAEVSAFAAEIKGTKVKTSDGEIPMVNWMNAYPEWGLFANFFENWITNKPFPRITGITI